GILPTRAVGKGQRDHHSLLLLTRCLRMQVSVAGLSWMASHLPSLPRARTCGKATPKLIRCDLYDGHAPRNAVRRLQRLMRMGRSEHARKRSAAGRWGVDGAIGAAPAPVAPGQVPARIIRQGGRYEIEPGRPKGMTAAEPRQRHPAARPQTEAADRLIRVGRAGRQMPAIEPDQCRNAMAVSLDQPTR